MLPVAYEVPSRLHRPTESGTFRTYEPQMARDRAWRRQTLHADILAVLSEQKPGGFVLDIGSGHDDFICSLDGAGFNAMGIDIADSPLGEADRRGLSVLRISLEDLFDSYSIVLGACFDAITLINVIEYVEDPVALIERIKPMIRPGGLLCIRTRNHESDLDGHLVEARGGSTVIPKLPGQLHALGFESLRRLVEESGLSVFSALSDFPVELQALLGDDFRMSEEAADAALERRKALELGLPEAIRLRLYSAFAVAGLGGNCMVFARTEEEARGRGRKRQT